MKKKKVRTWVKTFVPKFAPKVERWEKTNTIRPMPERECDIPKVHDLISCRQWSGRPYGSPQSVLAQGMIFEVLHVQIRHGSIWFPSVRRIQTPTEMLEFARLDGFDTLAEFHAWFLPKRRTVFKGIWIKWTPMANIDWKNVKAGDWIKCTLKGGAGLLQGFVTKLDTDMLGAITFDINDAVGKTAERWELREHRPVEP